MQTRRRRLAALALFMCAGTPALAVDRLVPSQFATISAAIAASSNGDRILISPGTYAEQIDLGGKTLTILGTGGAAATIIDGQGTSPVVRIASGEGPATLIQGVTITGGVAFDTYGAGALVQGTSPTFRDVTFSNNTVDSFLGDPCGGAGVASLDGSPTFIGCTFDANSVTGNTATGGAAAIASGSGTFTDCIVINNLSPAISGAGLFFGPGATGTVTRGLFQGNIADAGEGGGLQAAGATVTITDATFTGNSAPSGAGAALLASNGALVTIIGGSFTGNTMDGGGGTVYARDSEVSVSGAAFSGNSTPGGFGAAITLEASTGMVDACTFNDHGGPGDPMSVIEVGGGADVTVTGSQFENNYGSGVSAFESIATVRGSTFRGQIVEGASGGGVYVAMGDATVEDSTFELCVADGGSGAGVGGDLTGTITIRRCTFIDNRAPGGSGGAISATRMTELRIEDSTITGSVDSDSSGVSAVQTAVFIERTTIQGYVNDAGSGGALIIDRGTLALTDSTLINNSASSGGGASIGGAATTISGSTIRDNAGRGLFINGGNTTISRSSIVGNTGNGGVGAGLFARLNAQVTLVNSLVSGNNSNNGTGGGAVIEGTGSNLRLANCTVVGNSAFRGAGVRGYPNASLQIFNSIVRDNTATIAPDVEAANPLGTTIAYSNIEGGATGTGNIDAAPLFADAPNGDYRTLPGSPGNDGGDNSVLSPGDTLDLSGGSRFTDDAAAADTGAGSAPLVDMGAYELQDTGCPADFNGDGFVDFFDFDDFVVCFEGGACPPGKSADFNGDGFADFFDYDDFVIAFEAGC